MADLRLGIDWDPAAVLVVLDEADRGVTIFAAFPRLGHLLLLTSESDLVVQVYRLFMAWEREGAQPEISRQCQDPGLRSP